MPTKVPPTLEDRIGSALDVALASPLFPTDSIEPGQPRAIESGLDELRRAAHRTDRARRPLAAQRIDAAIAYLQEAIEPDGLVMARLLLWALLRRVQCEPCPSKVLACLIAAYNATQAGRAEWTIDASGDLERITHDDLDGVTARPTGENLNVPVARLVRIAGYC